MGGLHWLVGRQLLSGTSSSGITRLNNFYEHLGCTPCDSFDAETRRAGPWILKTVSGSVDTRLIGAHSKYNNANPPYTCTKHAITSFVPSYVSFVSGPSVAEATGDGTWDKELYNCEDGGCEKPNEPKPCSECLNRVACAGGGDFCQLPQGRSGSGRFYCSGGLDDGETCARTYPLSSPVSVIPTESPTVSPTRSPTKNPTVAATPLCTQCSDNETPWMIANGRDCTTDKKLTKRCNKKQKWRTHRYCQLSCYNHGLGYAGDNCCSS